MLAISIDSPFTHKVWQEGELSKMVPGGLPYPMLSDTGGRVGELYGVYDEANGVDIRGRFLIDPDGILQAMEVLAPAVGRNVAEMIRQIRACQFVRQTGEATPAIQAAQEAGERGALPGPRGPRAPRVAIVPVVDSAIVGLLLPHQVGQIIRYRTISASCQIRRFYDVGCILTVEICTLNGTVRQ